MPDSTAGQSGTSDRSRHGDGTIAVDQEGGPVQTLKGAGFDRVPTALGRGRQDPAALRSATAGWAGQLHDAEITMDLGPVADTVPAGTEADNPPIGACDRQLGSDPQAVAASVTTVVEALQDAGVVATAEHFPGLGRVRVNTDTDLEAPDPETSPEDRAWRRSPRPWTPGSAR
ncbi:glycoside hydrolase family 3 N-terminal domain-containing protein [Modestobacter altitudinis]|uniref:glycoside hydrolase family 3 N-terminal domain-containing protein n=1 Tax=Modestobacter altitudinis TaxID=2213158 RepID=UPI001FE96364|nr:glycoside hydrolase family 3 N-terminal domain-containing protein [Modestobacter altitudinis]